VFALLAGALTLSAFLSAFAGTRSAAPSAVTAAAADEDLA
jgi:hypothetical protein